MQYVTSRHFTGCSMRAMGTFGNLLVLRQGIRGHAVPYFRTRCEYIHVRSGATSLSLRVLK